MEEVILWTAEADLWHSKKRKDACVLLVLNLMLNSSGLHEHFQALLS